MGAAVRQTIAEALSLDEQALADDQSDDRRKDGSRSPTPGRRASRRRRVLLSALIVDLTKESVLACRVENVSAQGACLKLTERRFLPATYWLIAVKAGVAFPAKTIWREDDRLGIEVTGDAVDLQDATGASERRLQAIWKTRR
jgi:hypothetical protein